MKVKDFRAEKTKVSYCIEVDLNRVSRHLR